MVSRRKGTNEEFGPLLVGAFCVRVARVEFLPGPIVEFHAEPAVEAGEIVGIDFHMICHAIESATPERI